VTKAEVWFRLLTTLDFQLFMTWRHRGTNYYHLWPQIKVCRNFSSGRHWNCWN